MSIQFGRWNFDGKAVDRAYLENVKATLTPYGPDGGTFFAGGNIAILYHAFHTTKESRREVQPHLSASGVVITWDGRLDNRADLVRVLRGPLTVESTDLAIVASAYEKWGKNCFGKLIGDWSLSIWNPFERSLVLAKDPIGTRHLYYLLDPNHIAWSTLLYPLVRFASRAFELNEEYIAGWLSMFPAANLTPCLGVHAVPPSSFVLLAPGEHVVSRFWDFDPDKKIRYKTDAEYQEHFRAVFTTAVQRRLRSDRPILAELSGGRDSSSIVCVADAIIARGIAEAPRLDTVSYFDDSEPNWNERPYFTKIEEKRGRTGWHVNVSARDRKERSVASPAGGFVSTPGHDGRTSVEMEMCMASGGNRVVLSGLAGDEVMGGVPTPMPELENYIARARVGNLAHQLRIWALEQRRPWFGLFAEALRMFLPPVLVGVPAYLRPASWLQSGFVKRQWCALTGYPLRIKLFGPLPSFQESMLTFDALRRQLACVALPFDPPFEKRYPFVDRDLLEFMFAVPREQLVRPKQRRSLMRRALAGIVPDEILNRRAKAFVSRTPIIEISGDWPHLLNLTKDMLSSSQGIVDSEKFRASLKEARVGKPVPLVTLLRTIQIEEWLRDLSTFGLVRTDSHGNHRFRPCAQDQHGVQEHGSFPVGLAAAP